MEQCLSQENEKEAAGVEVVEEQRIEGKAEREGGEMWRLEECSDSKGDLLSTRFSDDFERTI